MLKKTLLVAAACALTFCLTLGNSSAEVNKGPAEMVLKTAKAKKPSKFNHKAHQDSMECATCHHGQTEDGKKGPYVAGEEKKCVTCHNKKGMTNKKLNTFKNAAHANCKACHKKEKKAGKKAPTKCTGCHPKGLK